MPIICFVEKIFPVWSDEKLNIGLLDTSRTKLDAEHKARL